MKVEDYILDHLYKKKMTKDEFAKSIGISPYALKKYLKGGNIGMHEFGRIVKALGGNVTVKFS